MNFLRTYLASLALAGLLWSAAGSAAAPWEFSEPQTVAPATQGVFHHLEAAGRQSIAISAGTVAVVWEDNRDGTPRTYVAFRAPGKREFLTQRLSGTFEAYAPVAAAVPQGGFVFGWEEDGHVWARNGGPAGLGPALKLSDAEAAQVALGAGELGVFAAWSERSGRHTAIRFKRLSPGVALEAGPVQTVTAAPTEDQLYPALAVLKSAAVLAWEDRRDGHTVIMYARTQDGKTFSKPQTLNEQRAHRSQTYGRGTGAARVALARLDAERAAAVWLDKRDFESGYDVYAAVSEPGGGRFQRNEMVQDEFGNNVGQWHAALAAQSGLLAVVWDDDRDGSPDIWLSWREASGWSANIAVPGAGGAGIDASPAVALDEAGHLHLVWLEQPTAEAPTRLRYVEGRRAAKNSGVPGVH
jgi:DNA-binding PadR family transcriptional regulator